MKLLTEGFLKKHRYISMVSAEREAKTAWESARPTVLPTTREVSLPGLEKWRNLWTWLNMTTPLPTEHFVIANNVLTRTIPSLALSRTIRLSISRMLRARVTIVLTVKAYLNCIARQITTFRTLKKRVYVEATSALHFTDRLTALLSNGVPLRIGNVPLNVAATVLPLRVRLEKPTRTPIPSSLADLVILRIAVPRARDSPPIMFLILSKETLFPPIRQETEELFAKLTFR